MRFLVLALVLVPSPTLGGGCERDAEAVAAVPRGLIAANAGGDLGGALAHYTADAEWIPPSGEPVRGREAIRARYEQLFATFRVDAGARIAEVGVGYPWSFVRGRTQGTLIPRGDEEEAVAIDHQFLMVLECEDDGVWRVDRLVWTSTPPRSAEP